MLEGAPGRGRRYYDVQSLNLIRQLFRFLCRFFSLDLSRISKGLQTFTFIVRQLRRLSVRDMQERSDDTALPYSWNAAGTCIQTAQEREVGCKGRLRHFNGDDRTLTYVHASIADCRKLAGSIPGSVGER